MDSLLPSITLECLLGNEPDPLPEFTFIIEGMFSDPGILNSSESDYNTSMSLLLSKDKLSILQLDAEILQLFILEQTPDEVTVTCTASNSFGNDTNTTLITICGKLLSSIEHIPCTQHLASG